MPDEIFVAVPKRPNTYCQKCLLDWFVASSYHEERTGTPAGEPDEDELDSVCREYHPWRFDD